MAFNFTGQLESLMVDFMSGKQKLVLGLNEDARQLFENLRDCKITITIKRYTKKRSLDANRYYWVLITKLAKVLKTSNDELHNQMLSEYGVLEVVDGRLMWVSLPDTEETEKYVKKSTMYHLKPTTEILTNNEGVDYRMYLMVRGSHSYNTEEMARLIEGLISECRSAGMSDAEIMTPDEKRQLKERYGVNVG